MPRTLSHSRLSLWAILVTAQAVLGQPRVEDRRSVSTESTPFRTHTVSSQSAMRSVPIENIPSNLRDRIRKVMTHPTMVTQAPLEEFYSAASTYLWLLDHPDRASLAWQRLNVPSAPIIDRGQGRFGWSDNDGSDVSWVTVAASPSVRVWYAEGIINPGRLLPNVSIKAVVVVRHTLPAGANAAGAIRHQADVFLSTDSRAANLAARILGSSAERMGQEACEQLLMFFSSLSEYLARHPEQSEKLLAPGRAVRADSAPRR